jgi:hypothetical protein
VKKADSNQPLSAMTYAVIALAGLIFALGFTFFYVYEVPKLVGSGVQGQVFYLLLLPWALACSAFLFGAMRSYGCSLTSVSAISLNLAGQWFCSVLFCSVDSSWSHLGWKPLTWQYAPIAQTLRWSLLDK